MIIYRAMSDLQDEGVLTDESDGKAEVGASLTKKDIEVARKIEENSSHPCSLSVDSYHSESSLQSSSSSGKSTPSRIGHSGFVVTFGITAFDTLTAVHNLSGWEVMWLSKTYDKVIGLTGMTRHGDFRVSFIPFFSYRKLTRCLAE